MTNIITLAELKDLTAQVATGTGRDLGINHCSAYGGYQLTLNNGASTLGPRSSAKETLAFLKGMATFVRLFGVNQ